MEFLDLQLQDAKDLLEAAKKALVDAGYDEKLVDQGSKALAKEIQSAHLALFYMLVGAEKYLAFSMKRRDYKYITATLNVAKSMLGVKVSDLDSNPDLLNTPDATYDLKSGVAGGREHDSRDLITKITECSPGDQGADIWQEALRGRGRWKKHLLEHGSQSTWKLCREDIFGHSHDGKQGKCSAGDGGT